MDRDRRPGRFLFTGSANLLKLPGVGDSLAGRLASVSLKPLSMGEMDGRSNPEDFVSWLLDIADSKSALPDRLGVDRAELVERVCAGGYPEPFFAKLQGADIGGLITMLSALSVTMLRILARETVVNC